MTFFPGRLLTYYQVSDFYDNLIIIIDIIVTYSAPKFRLHMTLRLMIDLILASMVNWMLDIGG